MRACIVGEKQAFTEKLIAHMLVETPGSFIYFASECVRAYAFLLSVASRSKLAI